MLYDDHYDVDDPGETPFEAVSKEITRIQGEISRLQSSIFPDHEELEELRYRLGQYQRALEHLP